MFDPQKNEKESTKERKLNFQLGIRSIDLVWFALLIAGVKNTKHKNKNCALQMDIAIEA